MSTPEVTVNGRVELLDDVPPHTTVLDWLRDLGLTGCKEGCAEGECGACSVMVARPAIHDSGSTEWVAFNACLVPVAALDGQELVTAEGLGTSADLHPVQAEIAFRGGSQCGYCTPGFVCSMAAEYYRPDRTRTNGGGGNGSGPDGQRRPAADAEHGPNGFDLHALSGNLCRCTGYRPIRDAAYSLGAPPADDPLARRRGEAAPPPRPTSIVTGDAGFVRPGTWQEALQLLAERPDAVVVAGATDWGVEVNLRGTRASLVIAIDRLPELRGFSWDDEEVRIGAAVTLSELERRLAGRIPLMAELFPQFASRLIRNTATLGGNLGTGSPIGDAPPVLLALDADLVLESAADGPRTVSLAEYFTGYRQSVRRADELIREVVFSPPQGALTAFHKIAKRRFDDISSVAVAYVLDVGDGVVRRARIGLGGVAAMPIRAYATESALVGQSWTAETVHAAAEVMAGEGTPMDDHRASASFRAAMLGQSLLKMFYESSHETEVRA
jgi:xanthine dehydrogenase small subunit